MTSLQATFAIIAASTVASAVYLAMALVRKSTGRALVALVMLLTPPVGILYFICGFVWGKLLKNNENVDLDHLTFSKTRVNRVIRPDVEQESQAVPFEEVLLVSADEDKRKHLLTQLKRDHIEHYGSIKKALDNDDPETSHYAASALTSAKSNFENNIRELDGKYIRNRGDLELVRAYADYVAGYLSSGILDPLEERKYSYLLINILTNVEDPGRFLTERDYGSIVNRAIYMQDFAIAEKWAKIAHDTFGNESTFLNLLKVYYYTNQSDRFFETLDALKKSDAPLSEEGLTLVRFFSNAKRG